MKVHKTERVYACYDGKIGRAVPVRVIKRRGFATLCEFRTWTTPHIKVRAWFSNGGAWVRSESALMPLLGFIREARETGGDWYSLVPQSRFDEIGMSPVDPDIDAAMRAEAKRRDGR